MINFVGKKYNCKGLSHQIPQPKPSLLNETGSNKKLSQYIFFFGGGGKTKLFKVQLIIQISQFLNEINMIKKILQCILFN